MDVYESTLSSKNQITLPKEVCKRLGLDRGAVGTKIVFLVEQNDVKLIKRPVDLIAAMQSLSEGKRFPNIREEFRKDRKSW